MKVSKILYFGIYPPKAPRDKVYISGLKAHGWTVAECVENSRSVRKYWNLIKMLKNAPAHDLIWVGHLSGHLVPIAKLFSRKPVLYNASYSMFEAYILDRREVRWFSPKGLLIILSDFLSFHLADAVLLESEGQKAYIAKRFFVSKKKLHKIYLGADTEIFYPDPAVRKKEEFTVVFRGIFIPATGIDVVLKAAEMLKLQNIKFLIIGWGQLLEEVRSFISRHDLNSVKLHTVFMEPEELHREMLKCHVVLGQFSKNPRLDRTIQHKTVEALALGMPFITRKSKSNDEFLKDSENCLLIKPDDPQGLAESILRLKTESGLREKISRGAMKTYNDLFGDENLSLQAEKIILTLLS